MSKLTLTKGLKVLGAAVGATAGVAGVVTTINTVVETINYEQVHEIVVSDIYKINGEEVDLQSWLDAKEDLDNKVTKTETNTIQVLAEEKTALYYGAVDTLDFELSDLTKVELDGMVNSYTCHINAGNVETEEGQYPVFAIPSDFAVTEIKVSGFSLSFNATTLDDYNVYYLESPSYDEDIGGITYNIAIR